MELVEYSKECRSLTQRAEECRRQQAQMLAYVFLVGSLMAVRFTSSGDLLSGSMALGASCCFVIGFKGEVGILESWKAGLGLFEMKAQTGSDGCALK